MAIEHAIHEGTFIELVLEAESRRELLELVNGRDHRQQGLRELASVVAPKCEASPDQLREAIALLDDDEDDGARLAAELLFHANMPVDVLLRFANDGRYLASIAHRRGTPRDVLEVASRSTTPSGGHSSKCSAKSAKLQSPWHKSARSRSKSDC